MAKLFIFRIDIKGLDNKIFRVIEINGGKTLADLAYAILSSSESLGCHPYEIIHNDVTYSCDINNISAIKTRLRDINLNNKTMIMNYDFNKTTTFNIELIDSRDIIDSNEYLYPNVIDGYGRGMLEDISGDELKEIIIDIEENNNLEHPFPPRYKKKSLYDHRYFNLKLVNARLKALMYEMKNRYENK